MPLKSLQAKESHGALCGFGRARGKNSPKLSYFNDNRHINVSQKPSFARIQKEPKGGKKKSWISQPPLQLEVVMWYSQQSSGEDFQESFWFLHKMRQTWLACYLPLVLFILPWFWTYGWVQRSQLGTMRKNPRKLEEIELLNQHRDHFLTFFFFFLIYFYWDIIGIQHCVSLRYSTCWLDTFI